MFPTLIVGTSTGHPNNLSRKVVLPCTLHGCNFASHAPRMAAISPPMHLAWLQLRLPCTSHGCNFASHAPRMAATSPPMHLTWLQLRLPCTSHGCNFASHAPRMAATSPPMHLAWLQLRLPCTSHGCNFASHAPRMASTSPPIHLAWLQLRLPCTSHGCNFAHSLGLLIDAQGFVSYMVWRSGKEHLRGTESIFPLRRDVTSLSARQPISVHLKEKTSCDMAESSFRVEHFCWMIDTKLISIKQRCP